MSDSTQCQRILLLTGAAGVGKSTIIRRVAQALHGNSIRGFITDEIRVRGRRRGFRLETFSGYSAVLAHTNIRSSHNLGKYGVDVHALDKVVDMALQPDEATDFYLVDEIGKMECFSLRFVAAMSILLDSGHIIVATIHRNAGGFIQRVKAMPEAELREVTLENRDAMVERVLAWMREVKNKTTRKEV